MLKFSICRPIGRNEPSALGPVLKVYLAKNKYFGANGSVITLIWGHLLGVLVRGEILNNKNSKIKNEPKVQIDCSITEQIVSASHKWIVATMGKVKMLEMHANRENDLEAHYSIYY